MGLHRPVDLAVPLTTIPLATFFPAEALTSRCKEDGHGPGRQVPFIFTVWGSIWFTIELKTRKKGQ